MGEEFGTRKRYGGRRRCFKKCLQASQTTESRPSLPPLRHCGCSFLWIKTRDSERLPMKNGAGASCNGASHEV